MEIKALDLSMESIILPVVILVLSLFLLALGIRLMGAVKRFEKVSGFVSVGVGLILFAGSLIPMVSAISAADNAADYRDYLYQEYSMKLEENSRLVLALKSVDEKTVIPVKDVVIGTSCGTKEKVDIYDLWVSRRGDTIYLFERDSKPLQLCGPVLSPITFRKMPW